LEDDKKEEKRECQYKRLEEKIVELSMIIEKSRIRDYAEMVSNPSRLIYVNLIIGLARGFGTAIGFTALAAIALYILKSWVDLPFIGQLIADLLDIIETYRIK